MQTFFFFLPYTSKHHQFMFGVIFLVFYFYLCLSELSWAHILTHPYPHSQSRHPLLKVNPVLQSSNYSITVKIIVLFFFFFMVKFYVKKSVLNIRRFLSSNNGSSIILFNGANCMCFVESINSYKTIKIGSF